MLETIFNWRTSRIVSVSSYLLPLMLWKWITAMMSDTIYQAMIWKYLRSVVYIYQIKYDHHETDSKCDPITWEWCNISLTNMTLAHDECYGLQGKEPETFSTHLIALSHKQMSGVNVNFSSVELMHGSKYVEKNVFTR